MLINFKPVDFLKFMDSLPHDHDPSLSFSQFLHKVIRGEITVNDQPTVAKTPMEFRHFKLNREHLNIDSARQH